MLAAHRSLLRNPGFLFATVTVLALGLAATTLVFTITRALLLSPLEYRDASALVQLRERDTQGNFAPLSASSFHQAESRSDLIHAPAAADLGMFLLTAVEEPEEFAGAAITSNTLQTLGVQPILGHDLRDDEPNEVLLSYTAWSRRFRADPDIVGKVIDLDWARTPQVERFRVAGVLPQRFWLLYRGLEVFIPLTPQRMNDSGQRRRFYGFARRSEAATVNWTAPLERKDWSLVGSSFEHDVTESSRQSLLLLSAAVSLLVLLVCANVANLFLARGLMRRKEFAIRIAVGASSWHLARIVINEAVIVSFLAVTAAIPMAYWALTALQRWFSGNVGWMQFTPGFERLELDGWSLAFAAAAAFGCSLLASALPALQSASEARQLRGASHRQPYRYFLIGVETALATLLLCGAGLLLRSLQHLDQADFGFTPSRILVVRVPGVGTQGGPAYYAELRRRVESLPGVESVTFTTFQPLTNSRPERRFTIADGTEDAASYCVVSENFFSAYRVAFRYGRAFTPSDRDGAPPVVIINEALAKKHFSGKPALGARVQFNGEATFSEVIGVVANISQSIDRPATPTIYRHAAQEPAARLQMGIRTRMDPLAIAPSIRKEIGLAGGAVAELSTLDDFVFGQTWRTRITGAMMTGFSMLALAVAAFGLFSVVAYSVNQRSREIGIRSALGARPADVVRMVVWEGLRPAAIGMCIGLFAALALSRFLQGLLYDVQPADPLSYGAAAFTLIIAACAALAIPARQAANVDPAESLRQM